MTQIITVLLALVQQIAPGATTDLIATIIEDLIQIVPVVIKEAQDLLPVIKNIIAALQSNPASVSDQLDALDQLDAQVDAAFDAAAAQAQADDDAAAATTTQPPGTSS